MLTVISTIVISSFVLLYILIHAAVTQANNFAHIIVESNKEFENDEAFLHYFLANSGIFVAGVIHRPAMILYSSLYSLLGFVAVVLAIINFMNRNWIILIVCIIIILHIFFSKTGTWFIHLNERICKDRTLHNWLSAYPNDFVSTNPLKFPPTMLLSDYYEEAFSISRKYFFNDVLKKIPTNISQCAIREKDISDISYNKIPTGTVQEVINNIDVANNSYYEIDCNDNVIMPLYTKMLNNRYELTNGPFNNTYFNIVLSVLKEKEATIFDEYNNTNKHFNFWNYSEGKDEQYSKNNIGLLDDSEYALIDHLSHQNVDNMETRYAALVARKQIHDQFLPFIEIYAKIRDMRIDNVRESIKFDRKMLNHNPNQILVEAEYEILIHIYYSFKEIFKFLNEKIDINSIQGTLNDLILVEDNKYSIGECNKNIISMYSVLLERRGMLFMRSGFEIFYIHFFFEKLKYRYI